MRTSVRTLFLGLFAFASVGASAQTFNIVSLDNIGCDAGTGPTATAFTRDIQPGSQQIRTMVDANGLRYMDEIATNSGIGPWHLFDTNSGGTQTGHFPLPPNVPIRITFEVVPVIGQPDVFRRQVTLSRCNGGTMTQNAVVPAGGPQPDPATTAVMIPTLGDWALISVAGLLMLAGGLSLRRRSQLPTRG